MIDLVLCEIKMAVYITGNTQSWDQSQGYFCPVQQNPIAVLRQYKWPQHPNTEQTFRKEQPFQTYSAFQHSALEFMVERFCSKPEHNK